MTERSRFWNSTVTGDATEAPYGGPTEFAGALRSLAGGAAIPTNLGGVFRGELNVLEVSGVASPVTVETGRALCHGNWYENDAAVTVAVPTPAGATRIDRIVLRKNWTAQTVRITRIEGIEGGGAPALTQNAGTTWDTPLAQASITTLGVITVTDEREFLPLVDHLLLVKSADETVNNSDVLQDDATFTLPLAAAEVWVAEFSLYIVSPSLADFKVAVTVPAGAALLLMATGFDDTNPAAGKVGVATMSGTAIPLTASFAVMGIVKVSLMVINGVTAGNAQLQWAQNTTTVGDTTVKLGSFMVAHRAA